MIEVNKSNGTQYQFSLKAKSGQILLKSIAFGNKDEMEKAIGTLNTTAVFQSRFERKTNHQGQFLFNLKDEEGNVIGSSQLYDSEMGMENGIKNLQNRLALLKNEDDS